MEILSVQQQYSVLGSNKVKDWSTTLTPPTRSRNTSSTTSQLPSKPSQAVAVKRTATSINKKLNRTAPTATVARNISKTKTTTVNQQATTTTKMATQQSTNVEPEYDLTANQTNNLFYCDNNIDATAMNDLSLRLLDELRAAKTRHLACTEVSLPCDLTPRIASEILRISEKEPCGIRGCTIYIEFEDERNNSRRIASLKLDPETVSTFEVYLTLRQDHRGWTSLLPQFMKNLTRTITISPEFNITKHKLYNTSSYSSYNYYNGGSTAITTPSS